MKKGNSQGIFSTAMLALLCIIFLSFAACSPNVEHQNIVYCADAEYAPYSDALSLTMPLYSVESADPRVFSYLYNGAAAEAFDVQAFFALESGVALYWYPQYIATVVIAVDRDRTDAQIASWSDLPAANAVVGYCDDAGAIEMVLTAIAYGLEGEAFTLKKAANLLAGLHAGGHLARNSFDAPIVICFDYQAAALKKGGRNIEIIVPEEGTLGFNKGILSNSEITFEGDIDSALVSAGLRLPGGEADAELYLDTAAYENVYAVKNYTHFGAVCRDATRVLRRNVFHTRVYSSVDQREHQYFVMIYIVLVILRTASFVRRAMHRVVRRASLLTGIILLCWIIVRLIKYQFNDASTLNRYFWYAYYLFQLSLPLVLLWLAWATDKQDGTIYVPKWLRALSGANAALILLVFTNDLHNFVFKLDLTNPNWPSEYSYGVGYYIVLVFCVLPLLAALMMLLVKSGRNPRKKRFLVPLVFCVLLALYAYGYIMRIPPAWDSDFTMVVGMFTLMFIEACFGTRLIPVNSKYTTLFTHSPLNTQLYNSAGQLALSSQSAMQGSEEWLARALAAYPLPVEKDENTLLYASPVTGGTAMWQEDISTLNRLHNELEESVRKLKAANAVLAEEEKIRRSLDEEKAKAQLMEQLENEIAGHTARLTGMIAQLKNKANEPLDMLIIALLLCYIKRHCNLFFRQRESDAFSADELTVYIDELAEIAHYGESRVLCTSEIAGTLPVRIATLFYDFFHAVLEWAVREKCLHMLVHIGVEKDALTMRILPSEDVNTFAQGAELSAAIAAAGGKTAVKDLDGATGISLSFPKGGEANA